MGEPTVKKYPTEWFGKPYTDISKGTQKNRKKQYCPFRDGICIKNRKSNPKIKIGICSIGYKGKILKSHKPVIICPHRFKIDNVFKKIEQLYFGTMPKGYIIKWVSEVSIGVGGSVDYVAAKIRQGEQEEIIEDFICVELQAAGTTGTPWQAILDLKKHGKYLKEDYPFGINWANEFVKTMMQQTYKKGIIVESWKKTIVFVLQDLGMKSIEATCDTRDLHDIEKDNHIHFCTFKMIWSESKNEWELEFDKQYSTKTEGIRKILAGASEESHPSVEEFKQKIKEKMRQMRRV